MTTGTDRAGVTTHLTWRKSSYTANNGNCVEVAVLPAGGIWVRDSKHLQSPQIAVSASVWRSFVTALNCPRHE